MLLSEKLPTKTNDASHPSSKDHSRHPETSFLMEWKAKRNSFKMFSQQPSKWIYMLWLDKNVYHFLKLHTKEAPKCPKVQWNKTIIPWGHPETSQICEVPATCLSQSVLTQQSNNFTICSRTYIGRQNSRRWQCTMDDTPVRWKDSTCQNFIK